MRRHVAISGLLAYLIGLSVGDRAKEVSSHHEETATASNRVVTFIINDTEIAQNSTSTIKYETAGGVEISTVRLRFYSGVVLDDSLDDTTIIASITLLPPTAPADVGGVSSGGSGGISPEDEFLKAGSASNTLTIVWSRTFSNSASFWSPGYVNNPLYLESEWNNTSISGSSTSPLFAVYDVDRHLAQSSLEAARKGSHISSDSPARAESITTSLSPTPSSPTATSKPPPQATTPTSQPAATIGPQSALPAPNGLSMNGIIGVAVGVSVGGLLVAGALSWLFCFRRRRRNSRNAAHHTMPSYDSDVGAHASMTDKETPVLLETASRQSAYGGEGRPSIDPYAPYSDRSAPSPTPHYRGTTSTDAPAAPAAPTTSQTDLTWTNGAPTPTPVIASRYAHLVEEGMTEEEIRRLEDEERQLDAAIENAGRRRDT